MKFVLELESSCCSIPNIEIYSMKKFKAIIVEDEKPALIDLLSILKEINFIEVIGAFDDFDKAEKAILYHQPDILFLDIEINREPVFGLLKRLEGWDLNFGIVFHTAHYEKYLSEAINKVGLKYKFQYLAKPVQSPDLIQTINEVRKALLNSGEAEKESILFTSQSGSLRLLFDEIFYCETDGGNALIYLTNEKKELVVKNLKQLNEELPRTQFYRMSGQYLINKQYFHKTHIAGDDNSRRYFCILQIGMYQKKLPIPPKQWKRFNEEIQNDPKI